MHCDDLTPVAVLVATECECLSDEFRAISIDDLWKRTENSNPEDILAFSDLTWTLRVFNIFLTEP